MALNREAPLLAEKLWIFPYKPGSESAKLLAEKADIWMIKHEGSKFVGKPGQFILNWGAGTGIYQARTGKATVLNPPELIDIAVNKWAFFDRMTDVGGPRMPEWTSSQKKAKMWLDNGETVIARTKLEGAKGAGIVVMKNLLDFVPAKLYTIKVKNVAEYRMYMFNDTVVDVRVKRGKPDANGMMVGDQIKFIQTHNLDDLPPDVVRQAIKAARMLKLTTQGLDVIWDGEKAYILESNTAPYLGIQTAEKYAVVLEEFVSNQKKAA